MLNAVRNTFGPTINHCGRPDSTRTERAESDCCLLSLSFSSIAVGKSRNDLPTVAIALAAFFCTAGHSNLESSATDLRTTASLLYLWMSLCFEFWRATVRRKITFTSLNNSRHSSVLSDRLVEGWRGDSAAACHGRYGRKTQNGYVCLSLGPGGRSKE